MQYLVTEGYKVRALLFFVRFKSTSPRNYISHPSMLPQEAAEQFALDTSIQPEVELATIGAPPALPYTPHPPS